MFREANLSDVEAIFLIERMSFFNDQFSRRRLSYLMTSSKGKVLVYERHKQILAYAIVLLHSTHRQAKLYSIAVKPNERGYNIGLALLKKCEFVALKLKKGMSLEVRVSNLRAIRFYKKAGYVQIGLKKRYYDDGEDAYIFAKDLK